MSKEFRTKGKPTKAKCPRCEKVHKMYMNWQGTGMPRKYCPTCRMVINNKYAETYSGGG